MGLIERIFGEKTPPPNNFSGEIATAIDDIYRLWQYPYQKYNPDMLATKKGGLKIYKDMRQDDQVKSCLQLKKAAVITPGWSIEGDNADQVDFLEYVFEQMDGEVDEFIVSMLSALDYGFSLHEKVYMYIDQGAFKGKIGLKALKPKSPTRIDFDTDEFGNLKDDGILQTQNNGKITRLPVDKFVLYSYQKEFDNQYGESDLKAAYRPWFVKTSVLRYWAIYLERFSIPIVRGKATSSRITDAQREEFKNLMKAIQAGMSVILPQDLSLELMESGRVDRGVFNQAIDALNVAIARAVLIPQLMGLVPQAGVGSYGKSETDLRVFDWVLGYVGKGVQNVVNEQIIRQLIDMNFGKQDEYPKFTIKPLKQEDKTKLAAAWSEAVARGAVTSTLDTQKYIRELLDFPECTPEEEVEIEKMRDMEMEAAKAKAAGGFGNSTGPAGNSGLAGKNPSGGPGKMANAPGMQNQYSIPNRQIVGPESRVDWEAYSKAFDEIEWASMDELTKAFSASIYALIKDAKKNSGVLSASSSRKPEE